jgi:hypothetical protein
MSIFYPINSISIASGLHLNRWNRPSWIDRNRSIYFDFILAISPLAGALYHASTIIELLQE